MLIRVLLTGFFCICFVTSFGQTISTQRKEDLSIDKFYKTPVSINSPLDSVSIAIRSISVADARPDSSAIGLIQIFKLDPRFIVTQRNFQKESELFVNQYVQCDKSDFFSVLMVINKFWISSYSNPSDESKIWNMIDDTSKEIKVSLFAKIEFYLYKDSAYYALYRFDSVFSADVKKSMNTAGNINKVFVRYLVQDALESSLYKLANMDSQWQYIVSSKRKFTRKEIDTHDRNYFDMPVLKDSPLATGVYLTFEEFKNNNPSIKEFQVTKDKLNDFISIKDPSGRQMPLTEAWGYCDSSYQTFIRSGHNYFKLQRRQNAFYIYGSNQTIREISQSSTAPGMNPANNTSTAGGNPLKYEDFKLLLRPFQLDWDTGKLD
jgi:hypothetical protein